MARLASFHLVREHPGRSARAMARLATDRRFLRRVDGLEFWRLLGTGARRDTGPSADLRRTAVFAVWRDEAALDEFLAASSIAARWAAAEEAWSVRLRGVGGHGRWRGYDVLGGLEPGTADGRVAIITRAGVRPRSWRRFRAASEAVSGELAGSPGLLDVVAIGEAPVGRLGTFSLWDTLADARRFATGGPHHRETVRRTRAERWYGEELFARFEPFGSSGSWDGRDPLA
jgi:heme-degrading monooxygenase HmoA